MDRQWRVGGLCKKRSGGGHDFDTSSGASIRSSKSIAADGDIDDLISACKAMGLDPYSGDLFAFRDVDATRIGVFAYDGHGFEWRLKRFSEGTLAWWPSQDQVVQILPRDLGIMLWGGDPREVKLPPMWRPLHAVTGEPSQA